MRVLIFLLLAGAALAAWLLAVPYLMQVPPPQPGRFDGQFELVPLFDRDHRPVMSNGHQYEGERNLITFRTDSGDIVRVFPGATTDLASIPSVAWPVLPPDGPYAEGAAFHDACYKSRGSFTGRYGEHPGHTVPAAYDYHGCNEILREAMVVLGVPRWKRAVIFEAVEWFGGPAFGH